MTAGKADLGKAMEEKIGRNHTSFSDSHDLEKNTIHYYGIIENDALF